MALGVTRLGIVTSLWRWGGKRCPTSWPWCSQPHPASFLDQRPGKQMSAWQQVTEVSAANGAFFCCSPPRPGGGRVGWGPGGVFPATALGAHIAHQGADSRAMAEEQRDLISDHGSSVFRARDTQRSALGSKAALSTLSILVALLIAGQAVTVYFVYQQNGQISKLTKTSQTLQLEALQRKLPASAKPAKGAKIAIMSMPLRGPSLDPTADVATAPASNKTEDQVKHLLLQADPRKKFPELKYSMMADNLKTLKTTMTDADWKSFESWMHKWLLFEMAKNTKPKGRKTTAAKKVQTKCQAEASSGGVQPGHFQPQCDENGDYLPKQCNASTGYCWCSYKNGTRIEGTATREKLDCPDDAAVTTPATTVEPEMTFSGAEAVKLAV